MLGDEKRENDELRSQLAEQEARLRMVMNEGRLWDRLELRNL